MSLEEKIAIYQFGQEVHSDKPILDHVNQLGEFTQRMRLYDLYSLVLDSNPVSSDIDQAIVDSSLNPTDAPCVTLKAQGLREGMLFMPAGENKDVFKLLLYVFKIAYQRQYALNKENATDWWYLDLSKPEIVQELLTRHRELAEEIYANPSFRSEFVSLSKLWFAFNKENELQRTKAEEYKPEIQTKFDFITYDDMLGKSILMFDESLERGKHSNGMGVLQNSVSKGLATRYKLAEEQARLLVVDVIQRHMQETYGLGKKPYF